MTIYGDNILSGSIAITSGLSSVSPVLLTKTHRFTQPSAGGATVQTITGTFPADCLNLDAKLYIMNQGTSATTSDKITVSAAGVNLLSFTAIGSATGILKQTTVGLGTYTPIASACFSLTGTSGVDLAYSVTFLPVSASKSTDYQLQLMFNRKDKIFD